jgi:deferrochelatase/peroxidase EfeB
MSIDLTDVQGNVVRGYGLSFDCARHLAVGVGDAAAARAFIGALVDGTRDGGVEVTSAEEWDDKPLSCMNVGITWQGLQKLGVAAEVLAEFPPAFQQGPALRAETPDGDFKRSVGLGDVGPSAPEHWIMGGTATPAVHLVLSAYARSEKRLDDVTAALRAALADHGLTELSHHDARGLPGGRVHFGYRDGIAQPRIAGAPGKQMTDMQPDMPAGDLLLGKDYENAFGGNYAGDLPSPLADNATYGAFRILRQDVAAFEELLERWGEAAAMDPEVVAAKLMGRWRNGVPLVLSPDTPAPDRPVHDGSLNAFDYAPGPDHPTFYDDTEGLRCPVGAHVRRLNPRGSLVMGKPHSRRLVRRGMPYGPELETGKPDDGVDRGLVGYFLCADLEMQWEFIQRAWVHEDLATHGIRGTREPVGGTQPDGGGKFTIRTADSRDPIVLGGLPTLVQTRGSAYCMLPGIGGLRYLASLPDSQAVTA